MASTTAKLLCILPFVFCACESMDSKAHSKRTEARRTPSAKRTDPMRSVSTQPVAPLALSDDARLRITLRTKTLPPIDFSSRDSGDLLSAIRTIQAITNIPIIMTPAARQVIDDEGLGLNVTLTTPLRIDHLLDLIVDRSENLAWTVKFGVVQIRSGAETADFAELRVYDVRELLFARTEFIAPTIRGIPTGDDDTMRTGGEGEERTQTFEADALIANLKLATDPSYWDRDGGGSIDATESGYLIVKASAEMHRKLGGALGR